MPKAPPHESASGAARLAALLLANALLRVAGGAGGILVGLYMSALARQGTKVDAALVGTVGAVSFSAELLASLPAGILSDAFAPRWLMTLGALLGAFATQLFGMTGRTSIFFTSRALEGAGTAAGGPAVLAHLTDVSSGKQALRARVMSFYDLSFLAGLALGGVLGSQLWRLLGARAFAAVSGLYLVCGALFCYGAAESRAYGTTNALGGLLRALRNPYLRKLAPVWLCVNTIAGLWLGPTLTFLFTQKKYDGQFLAGIFRDAPQDVGWVLLWYAIVFGAGVTIWSAIMPRIGAARSLRIGLMAMPPVCLGLYALNHSAAVTEAARWAIGISTGALVMVESGFTPAALSLLAAAVGAHPGRGSAMGIYSVLLSAGAIAGSFAAAFLGQKYSVDGLIYGTLGLGALALFLAPRADPEATA